MAAVRSRQSSRLGRNHLGRPGSEEDIRTFRPQDHLKYLCGDDGSVDESDESPSVDEDRPQHNRIPSDATDQSTSTVTDSTAPSAETTQTPKSPALGDYAANLAKFIQSQLKAIPSYDPMVFPPSCPDLTSQSRTGSQSPPMKKERKPSDMPHVLEIPKIRPPLRSAFSAWSVSDDGIADDETEEPVLPLPSGGQPRRDSTIYDPTILRYYENSNDASFLFSSTPLPDDSQHSSTSAQEDDQHPLTPVQDDSQHPNMDQFTFPKQAVIVHVENSADWDDDASPIPSPRRRLSSASAPSLSPTSTASYFEYNRPLTLATHVRNRILAAVSSYQNGRVLTAISPFEGGALATVHDVFVESQKRVHVDGLSFDLIRNFNIPGDNLWTASRVSTPC